MTAHPHLLMLDFDGTLSEIVSDPLKAAPHPRAIPTLKALRAAGHEVYIVSGRSRRDLKSRLPFDAERLIGLHGLEWPNEYMNPTWAEEARRIVGNLPQEEGLFVEDKGYTVAVHYRGVREDSLQRVVTRLDRVPLPKHWEMICGKCVREFRPKGAGKGRAALRLMKRYPALPAIFVGDDVTDEAAFESVQRSGGQGIKVGPGPTLAKKRVKSVPGAIRLMETYC